MLDGSDRSLVDRTLNVVITTDLSPWNKLTAALVFVLLSDGSRLRVLTAWGSDVFTLSRGREGTTSTS